MELLKFLSTNNLLQVEKQEAIVIHLQDDLCLAGLSGEHVPRLVETNVSLSHCTDGVDTIVVRLDEPSQLKDAELCLERFLRRVTLRGIQSSLAERKCVVSLPLTATEVFREALANVILDRLRCPGLVIITSACASLIPLNEVRTALVIEFAKKETRVLPVVEGIVSLAAVRFAEPEEDSVRLAKFAIQAIMASPVDVRVALVQHIVLIGGIGDSKVEFLKSLTENLDEPLVAHVHVETSPFASEHLAWVGASLVGASLGRKAVADEEIVKKGSVIPALGQL